MTEYTITTFFVHLIFALLLFFIINWIGKQSLSIGYIQMSLFESEDEAPAFNFLVRVFSPVVYLIIISSILYKLELDYYVCNVYIISILYVLIRLSVNLMTNRSLLMNWIRQFSYWFFIIVFSVLAYNYLIKDRQNITPDLTTIANELWIIILLFIYQLFNNIKLSSDKTIKRKNRYITSRYEKFNRQYDNLIHNYFGNDKLEALTYSIMIYEDFNRPAIVRFFEKISFQIKKKPHTLGIMQFYTNKYITDKESLELGIQKIKKDYKTVKNEIQLTSDYFIIKEVAIKYNSGNKYADEIYELYAKLIDIFYKGTLDVL